MTRRVSKSKRPRPPKDSPPPPRIEPEPEKGPSIALVVAVVLTAILEVLDITIVSVAMPHMLGAFGATSDQITWVLTSYLVAAAIVMPLTGYLSRVFGRRRLLIFSIVGFVISSALCGLSWNLLSMVIFRIAQGICGAPLVALSQSILLEAFPREKHGQALAIFGLGIMVAPVLGPVLGGWLTDTFVWRAVFYINVPIGAIALLLAMGQLARVPMNYSKTDWTGLTLLVLAVGSLQLVLDQGPTRDWFDSRFIQVFTGIAVFAGAAFLMRGWGNPDNIIRPLPSEGPEFRRRRRHQRPPRRDDEARQEFAPRSAPPAGAASRLSLLTASALSVPARTYGIDGASSPNMMSTWPAIRSFSAGPLPRYGTWLILTPAIELNSSAVRCAAVAMPCEA